MSTLEIDSHGARRARTRGLVQLGSLVNKSGLLETFGIILGEDLQKSPSMKEPVAALFKGLIVMRRKALCEAKDSIQHKQRI